MRTLHDTGAETDAEDDETHPVVWWEHSKWDHRVCGPADQVFPRPDGWLLDGKDVRLDKLNVKVATKAMAMREPTVLVTRAAFTKVALPALLQFQRGLNLALKQDGERTLLYLLRPFDANGGNVAAACAMTAAMLAQADAEEVVADVT